MYHISAPITTMNGAYRRMSQVLISGMAPSERADNPITHQRPWQVSFPHRFNENTRRKMKKTWLNMPMRWGWTSPQRNEKSGNSLIASGIVLVLFQKSDPAAVPRMASNTKEGLTIRNVASGSHLNRSRSRWPRAYMVTAESAKTVGSARLKTIFDGAPLTTPRDPIAQ